MPTPPDDHRLCNRNEEWFAIKGDIAASKQERADMRRELEALVTTLGKLYETVNSNALLWKILGMVGMILAIAVGPMYAQMGSLREDVSAEKDRSIGEDVLMDKRVAIIESQQGEILEIVRENSQMLKRAAGVR
jgi:hypothetical protein